MNLLSEKLKLDIALTSQSLVGAGTGQYYAMGKYRRALFVAEIGAMAAAATSALQVMQAKDANGTSAKVVTNNAATITANTKVSVATLTLAAVAIDNKVTINGLTYTAAAAADLPNRVFAQAGDNTEAAASLAAAINHATAGVPGITATSNLGVVTLVADEPGDQYISITNPSATITPATVRAIGYVECDASFLDLANGFDHVALRITNSAAIQTGAILIRGDGRYTPDQYVAAAKTNVEA